VSDTGTLADETDLLNLTCNELDDDATIDADTKTALRNILEGGLTRSEACTGSSTNKEPALMTTWIIQVSTS